MSAMPKRKNLFGFGRPAPAPVKRRGRTGGLSWGMTMSDAVIISLIAAGSSLMAALVGMANNVLARKNDAQNVRIETHLEEAKATSERIVKQTDGLSEKLATVTGEKEFARAKHESAMQEADMMRQSFGDGLDQGHADNKKKSR